MNVQQCPRCEVRFPNSAELKYHLATDHPGFRAKASSVEGDLLGTCHCHHHGGSYPPPGVRPIASGAQPKEDR